MRWYVEVDIERFRKQGGQNFLSFSPDVHVKKCGCVGAFRESPFHAAFIQRALKATPSFGIFGKVWVVAPNSKSIINVSLQEWCEAGELMNDVFFFKNAQKRICSEVAGEVPVAIPLSCSANRSQHIKLVFFSTISRTETIAFSSDMWTFKSCSSHEAMREMHRSVGMLG